MKEHGMIACPHTYLNVHPQIMLLPFHTSQQSTRFFFSKLSSYLLAPCSLILVDVQKEIYEDDSFDGRTMNPCHVIYLKFFLVETRNFLLGDIYLMRCLILKFLHSRKCFPGKQTNFTFVLESCICKFLSFLFD